MALVLTSLGIQVTQASPNLLQAAPPVATRFAYDDAQTHYLDAAGVRYAYRRFGLDGGVPLVFLHRFRGTIDHWDPALLDVIARERSVIVFDNAGVGLSTGETADSIAGMALAAFAFIDALGFKQVDIFGWSMGGAVAQQLALDQPRLVRRIILAGTGPGGVPDAPPANNKVREIATKPVNDDEDFLYLFFAESQSSRAAGTASLRRIDRRLRESGLAVRPESWKAQAIAAGAWLSGKTELFPRLGKIDAPVLVANGMHDVMIHAFNSYAMAQRLPNAQLVIYPDAGHGFLFQYSDKFGRQVLEFLR